MEAFEFEGKTAEEAIENACRQLNLTKEEMEIEIIEPGSAGIFGLVGGRKAKVKVTTEREEPEHIEEGNGLAVAKETLKNILVLMPMEGIEVQVQRVDGTIALNIEGDKSGLLIGRKGRTLDALQYIVNKIVNKTLEKRVQVIIDSENYRQRRQEYLIQMALKMGDKAKRIRKALSTNLLNSHDRRIVHLALRDDQQLNTKSRGEGLLKKIVISPKR
jgi:spoIIIJ-associated protein